MPSKRLIRQSFRKHRDNGYSPQLAWTRALAENVNEFISWLKQIGATDSEVAELLQNAIKHGRQ